MTLSELSVCAGQLIRDERKQFIEWRVESAVSNIRNGIVRVTLTVSFRSVIQEWALYASDAPYIHVVSEPEEESEAIDPVVTDFNEFVESLEI